MEFANFEQVNKYLAGFYTTARRKYTLDNMRGLMDYLGNPQEKYRVVHVAGTSGKTSTAYYSSALLTAMGYKTGLTVSPHVDEINERVQINGLPLEKVDFCAAFSEFANLLSSCQIRPSWFEFMVAFAFWHFAKAEVDYAVVEVGLGGLLDGTNVIDRADKVCIITDIGFDHTKILGDTLPEIAAQKAGIIHAGNAVYVNSQPSEVMAVFEEACVANQAQLHVGKPEINPEDALPTFQQRNFALALAAIQGALQDRGQVLSESVKQKARAVNVPGRMEVIQYKNIQVILDGSHNGQKIGTLIEALKAKYNLQDIAILAAFSEGDTDRLKDALNQLSNVTKQMTLTSFVTAKDEIKHPVDRNLVETLAKKVGIETTYFETPAEAFKHATAQGKPVVLVTGSFYLLNHIRPLMLEA